MAERSKTSQAMAMLLLRAPPEITSQDWRLPGRTSGGRSPLTGFRGSSSLTLDAEGLTGTVALMPVPIPAGEP